MNFSFVFTTSGGALHLDMHLDIVDSFSEKAFSIAIAFRKVLGIL